MKGTNTTISKVLQGTKQTIQSKTIVSAIIGGIATLLKLSGVAEVQADELQIVIDAIIGVIQLFSTIGVIYGRTTAEKKITL